MPPEARLPLLVGVTGHRDLRPEDLEPLGAEVRRILDELRTTYPDTPIVIVSPLAEGADRLVARVGLDLGLRLVAPLPLKPADYCRDFAGPDSVAEFEALSARAERRFVVTSATGEPLDRPNAYMVVGNYVARHCHLLIALWNGRTPNKIGGTAEIVRHRLEGADAAFKESPRLLDMSDTGLVYQIVTPRQSEPSVEGAPFERRVLTPPRYGSAAAAEEAYRRTCGATDAFNRLIADADARVRERRQRSAAYLLPSLPAAQAAPGLAAIRALYACADEAAIRFQRHTHTALVTLFSLAFGIGVALEFSGHGADLLTEIHDDVKLLAYLGLFGVGLLVYWWASARQIDQKYLDYRALAEGLRVEFYWRVAGVPAAAADHSVRYRLDEMEWIRLALRACDVLTPSSAATEADAAAALRAVVADWVRGQNGYFARAAHADQGRLARLERLVTFFVVAGIGVALLLVAFILASGHWTTFQFRHKPWLFLVVDLAPVAAGLLHGYAQQRALSVHIKRYERMGRLFGAALRLLDPPMRAGDWAAARRVLLELGREALEENGDWVMLHRERPMELPA